jgi:hypothetical protein
MSMEPADCTSSRVIFDASSRHEAVSAVVPSSLQYSLPAPGKCEGCGVQGVGCVGVGFGVQD